MQASINFNQSLSSHQSGAMDTMRSSTTSTMLPACIGPVLVKYDVMICRAEVVRKTGVKAMMLDSIKFKSLRSCIA